MSVFQQPLSNGFYYKPNLEALDFSDAYVYDDFDAEQRFVVWCMKGIDENSKIREDISISLLVVELRQDGHLWKHNTDVAGASSNKSLVGLFNLADATRGGFDRFATYLHTVKPFPVAASQGDD